jgi:hypothetical protein
MYFTDEKVEDSGEVNFWKIDIDEIRYYPPKEPSAEFEKFIQTSFTMRMKKKGLRTNPFFTVSEKNTESNLDIIYEAGYGVKNLFTDLSVIKTKTMTNETPELLEKFSISEVKSPKLELYESGKLLKTILIGKDNKSTRFFSSEKFIISSNASVFDNLKNSTTYLREKQQVFTGESRMHNLEFISNSSLKLENISAFDSTVSQQVWFKSQDKKKKVNPNSSTRMEGFINAISTGLFPDDKDGLGFTKVNEFVSGEPISTLNITLANGTKYKIRFYPKTEIKGSGYYPILRSIENELNESPAYIRELAYNNLVEILNTIRDEAEWIEPKK